MEDITDSARALQLKADSLIASLAFETAVAYTEEMRQVNNVVEMISKLGHMRRALRQAGQTDLEQEVASRIEALVDWIGSPKPEVPDGSG